ncbi:hypothetical protein KJ564_03890 [bacterium]|nr:hypothetical protein [bacterium]
MTEKKAGWILIGIACVIGALRLLDVIDNSITAVFMMLAIIMVSGGVMGAKKNKREKAAQEAASQQTDKET